MELRKANKDENFMKRRNISVDLSSDYISNEMVSIGYTENPTSLLKLAEPLTVFLSFIGGLVRH